MFMYMVFGIMESESDEFKYFYGAFSTNEKAQEIIKSLEKVNENDSEEFVIEIHRLDEPTDVYYYMMS